MDTTPNIVPPEEKQVVIDADDLMEFSTAKVKLNLLVNNWKTEIDETERRRKIRDVDVSTESLRKEGKLDEDETLIPVRVIDTNIQREQPAYINYIKNSRRLATFRCLNNPKEDTNNIEQEFTQGMSYTGWETTHFKVLDGAQTHGFDSCEVVFDTSKPLNVALEQVGHEKLFFPLSSLDIQQAPYLVRAYDVTIVELRKYVKDFDFDEGQVDLILASIKSTRKEAESIRIYKFLFKKEDVVWVSWFCLQHGVTDWLKKCAPLYLGIRGQTTDPLTGQPAWQDTPITMYPIFLLPYRETEKPKVIDHKGRVFLDENKQEATTAILSGYINGLNRSIEIKASPKTDDGTGNSVKEVANKNIGGAHIFDKPLDFWHIEAPSPETLKAIQYLDVANSQETSQTNFAVMNREDSRKTAKEIETANNQAALLNSVQLTLFSCYIRSVYSFVWLIVQSQALQNKITFLLVEKQKPQIGIGGTPVVDPQTQQPVMESYFENDFQTIAKKYELRAAGDVDVIQRQEQIQQMQQDWEVIQSTPLRDRFLQDLIKLKYPTQGEQYAMILQQGSSQVQMQSVIGQMATTLAGFIKSSPDLVKALPAEQQKHLQDMLAQAQQFMQPVAGGQSK